jgi:hypothetical protein
MIDCGVAREMQVNKIRQSTIPLSRASAAASKSYIPSRSFRERKRVNIRNGNLHDFKPSMSQCILHAPSPRPDSRVPGDEYPVSPYMRSSFDQRILGHSLSMSQRAHTQLIRKRFSGHRHFAIAIFLAFVVHLSEISASGLQCFEDAQVAAVVLAHSRPGALRITLKSLKQALISSSGLRPDVALYISIDSNPRAARCAFLFLSKAYACNR